MCRSIPLLLLVISSAAGMCPCAAPSAELPAELIQLHDLFGSIPDCTFDYIRHYEPPIDGVAQHKYRFMTKGSMWRFDRFDEAGQLTDTWCFDGTTCYAHHPRGGMLKIFAPDMANCNRDFKGIFPSNPLFSSVAMPFYTGLKEPTRIHEVSSPWVWMEVFTRGPIRRMAEAPAGEAHFTFDNAAFDGVMKLAEGDGKSMPPWRVLEQSYTLHQWLADKGEVWTVNSVSSDWRRFEVAVGAVLFMPVKTTSHATVDGKLRGGGTTELLPETVKKLPDEVKDAAFSIPRNVVRKPFDFTTPKPARQHGN